MYGSYNDTAELRYYNHPLPWTNVSVSPG